MMPLTENGVTVDFPDTNYFQFSNCAAYQTIKSYSVKEMDICWLDSKSNILWIIELKAFDNPENIQHESQDLTQTGIVDHWISEFYKKAIHTLCMIETDRTSTKSCVINGVNIQTTFKLVFLVNVIAGQESELNFMQDRLRAQLKPSLSIFKVSSMVILAYSQARNKKILPWII